uniref:FLYWCH-type domain-containing protein n=1 Tax=Anopheles epiroticus TaxID=199890 RepID=A0A182PMZ2_9DIPT
MYVLTFFLEYILSQRGYPLLVVKNYLFRKNRDRYWRCIRCTKYKCRSRVILRGKQGIVVNMGKHTHGPETAKIEMGRKIRDGAAKLPSGSGKPFVVRQAHCHVDYLPATINHYCNVEKLSGPAARRYEANAKGLVHSPANLRDEPARNAESPLSGVCLRAQEKLPPYDELGVLPKQQTAGQLQGTLPRPKGDRRNGFMYDLSYEMVNNRQGGLNLHFRGYIYRRKTNFSQTTNWVCANPLTSRNGYAIDYTGPCAARCITDGAGGIRFSKKWHNHDPIVVVAENSNSLLLHQQGIWLDQLPYKIAADACGNRMHLLGYTYRKAASFRSTTDWVCTENDCTGNRRCLARLVQRMEDVRLGKWTIIATNSEGDASESEDNVAVFSTTMRGKEQLVYKGQPFVFEKLVLTATGQSKKIWRCNQWWNQKCRARVYTIDDHITPLNRYHTHSDIVKRKQRVAKRDKSDCGGPVDK